MGLNFQGKFHMGPTWNWLKFWAPFPPESGPAKESKFQNMILPWVTSQQSHQFSVITRLVQNSPVKLMR